jgi:transcriptional regulator with XRE-family HTH domain
LTSIYSSDYRRIFSLLVEARIRAEVTQQELATRLGRPQSFVSKFERAERRLDIAEFLGVYRLIGADPYKLLRRAEKESGGR